MFNLLSANPSLPKTCLVTPTYKPDLERFNLLARSCDLFCSDFCEHLVIVPKKDLAVFEPVLTRNMRLITVEEILGNILWQTPYQRLWFDFKGLKPYSGWLVQQLVKLGCVHFTEAQGLVFVDSDVSFVAPFSVRDVWQDQKLRFYSAPRAPLFYTDKRYLNWYNAAASLINQVPTRLHRAYIAQLNGFHRDVAKALLNTIAARNAESSWQQNTLALGDISEFILYGVFAEDLGLAPYHYMTEQQLCFSSWFYDLSDKHAVSEFIRQVPKDVVAIHVQSNLGFDAAVYASAVRAIHKL